MEFDTDIAIEVTCADPAREAALAEALGRFAVEYEERSALPYKGRIIGSELATDGTPMSDDTELQIDTLERLREAAELTDAALAKLPSGEQLDKIAQRLLRIVELAERAAPALATLPRDPGDAA